MPKIKSNFFLLPPSPYLCQACAVDHPIEDPHNRGSLYYQFKFHADHGRWPTWVDAMDHCDEKTKAEWSKELLAAGVKLNN